MADTAGSDQFHYARPPIIVLCYPIPFQTLELEHQVKWNFAIPILSQLRIKCESVTNKFPSLLGSMLLILLHKHYPLPWIVPHTRLP